MGYRIEYDQEYKPQKSAHKPKIWAMAAAFLLAFLLCVNAFWPKGQKVLRQILFPMDSAAIEVFVTQLRYGEPVSDAVESFCREVLSHESFP